VEDINGEFDSVGACQAAGNCNQCKEGDTLPSDCAVMWDPDCGEGSDSPDTPRCYACENTKCYECMTNFNDISMAEVCGEKWGVGAKKCTDVGPAIADGGGGWLCDDITDYLGDSTCGNTCKNCSESFGSDYYDDPNCNGNCGPEINLEFDPIGGDVMDQSSDSSDSRFSKTYSGSVKSTGGGQFFPDNPNAPEISIGYGTAVVWEDDLKKYMSVGDSLQGHNGYIKLNIRKGNEDYELLDNPYIWLQDEFLDIAGWSKYFDTSEPDKRKSPLTGKDFFYNWYSLNGDYLSIIQTRKGNLLVAMNAPMHGGSVFIREPSNENDGYNAYVVTGRNHYIKLEANDGFDPIKGEGSILFGSGKIYYKGANEFNLSEFTGAIRTKNGVYLISERKPLMMPKTTALLKIRNKQHLDILRKFDPPFLVPAFNSKIKIGNPRREWQEINQEGVTKFSSHADPGFYYVASLNSPFVRNNGVIADKRYGFDLPTMEERMEVSKDFVPYINNAKLGNKVFKQIAHRGVAAVLKVIEDQRTDYDPHYLFDIDNNHLYQSLKSEVKKVLDGMEDIGGGKLPRSYFLNSFHRMILNNSIDDFDFNYLKDYYTTHIGHINYKRPFSDIRTLIPLSVGVDSRYGFTAQMLKEQRTQKHKTKIRARNLPSFVYNPDVVSTIIQNIRPLDYRKYDDPDTREKLKVWHILPEDIRLSLKIKVSDDVDIFAKVKNDESLKFTIGETTYSLSADGNYTVPITRGNATSYLPLDISNLQYAYSLPNEAKQKIYTALGQQEGPVMDVITTDTATMLTASVSADIADSFVLELDSSSIKETYQTHEFIRTTKTEYATITEDRLSSIISESPFPTRTYYIDYNDPILSLLNQENKAFFYFNSLSFAGFGPNINVNLVREIPKYIRIIPTNKTKNNLFHGKSKLFTLNNGNEESVRRLSFVRGIDKELYKTGLSDPIGYEIKYPWPNATVDGRASTFDTIEYVTRDNDPALTLEENYIDSVKPARTVPGINALYDVVKKLGERFIMADGLSVYDVLSRVGARTYYSLFNGEIDPGVVEQLKAGNALNMGTAATEIPWYKNTIYNNITAEGTDQYMARSRLIKARTGSTPTIYDLEIYNNASDRSYIGQSFEDAESIRVKKMKPIPTRDKTSNPGGF